MATTLTPPAGYSISQLLFEDNFTTPSLDQSKWNPWLGDDPYGRWSDQGALPNPYSGMNESSGTYQIMYNDPYPYGYSTNTDGNHLVGGNGNLALIATPSSDFSSLGYSWASAAVSTADKAWLPATGGYVQWDAKMPDSRYGAWAGLWMMSANGPEMDVQESGNLSGSANANDVLASHWWGSGGSQVIQNTGVDLSAGFHTYGVEYRPGQSWTVYLDGKQMAQWTTGVPTNAAYEVIMDVEMAGPSTAGWHTVADAANHPGPFELDVSDVQIYSLSNAPVTPPATQPVTPPVTAPPAPTGLALSAASDSGVAGDNITDIVKPTITGQGQAGDSLSLFDGTTQVGKATVQTNGSWSATTTTLAQGTHSLDAKESNSSGTTSASSSALNISIVTTAPTVGIGLVSDTGSSSTDNITSNPALKGTADANATVTIREGTTTLGTTTANGSGAWSFTPTLANGAHTLTASDANAAGNTGTAALSFTLDTVAPSLVDDVTLQSAAGGTTTIASSQLRADDSLSTHAQETYKVSTAPANGTLLLNGSAATSFSQDDLDNNRVSYRETASGASSDKFSFTVSDAAGNTSSTQQFSISIGAAATAPPLDPAAPVRDFNGDGKADIVLQNSSTSQVSLWMMNGASIIASGSPGTPGTGWQVEGTGDFNGDGKADLLFQNSSTNQVYLWEMNGESIAGTGILGSPAAGWQVKGTGDFNADHKADIVFQNTSTNQVYIWEMNGVGMVALGAVATPAAGWQVKTTGDFNGDGKSDIVLQDSTTNDVAIWEMNGLSMVGGGSNLGSPGTGWTAVTTGQFTGDGRTQIVLDNNSTGQVRLWETNGSTATTFDDVALPGAGWQVKEAANFTGGSGSDLLLQNQSTGQVMLWDMTGTAVTGGGVVSSPGSSWHIPNL